MTGFRLSGALGWLVVLGAAALPVAATDPVTAEQVLARCADALGGADRIAAVRTLRFSVSYPDSAALVVNEISRPSRIRTEAGYILVFDGARAGFLKGAPASDGIDPGPLLLAEESWKDFEVDIAFLFPAFFDHEAEYAGAETVAGTTYHALKVALPLGAGMTYYLDGATFLPSRMVADVPSRGAVYHPERVVGDYRETAGVLFPRTFTSTGWGEKGRATVVSVEVNPPLGDERFEPPPMPREGDSPAPES